MLSTADLLVQVHKLESSMLAVNILKKNTPQQITRPSHENINCLQFPAVDKGHQKGRGGGGVPGRGFLGGLKLFARPPPPPAPL